MAFSLNSFLFIQTGIIKNILRLGAFRTMGRLTFGAYLIHPTYIRLMYGSMRSPFWTDDIKVVKIYILVSSLKDNLEINLWFFSILLLLEWYCI